MPVEAMAKQLGSQVAQICAVGRTGVVVPAYHCAAKVGITVKELVNAGHQQIELPYFLFVELQMRSPRRS